MKDFRRLECFIFLIIIDILEQRPSRIYTSELPQSTANINETLAKFEIGFGDCRGVLSVLQDFRPPLRYANHLFLNVS